MIGIEEVAQLAEVSAATVSRALSKPDMVAKETRERVVQAAHQLGYQPNQVARSLRQQKSRSLGLVITDILNPFQAQLAKGVQDAAEKHDYTLMLFNTDEAPEKERRALNALRGHLPQGLLLMPTAETRENLKLVANLPTIELDRSSGTPGVHTVMVNNVAGAKTAVQHLTELGHKRIGIIVGRLNVSTAQERLQGYREALENAGIAYNQDLVVTGNHREEGGRMAAKTLLSLPTETRPTALFVGNNEMTVGAVMTVREMGLRIPEDVSIVGFDDTRWAQSMEPPLTVVAQPTYQIGFMACEALLNSLNRSKIPNTKTEQAPQWFGFPSTAAQSTTIRLDTSFIVRRSTAPPTPKPAHKIGKGGQRQ